MQKLQYRNKYYLQDLKYVKMYVPKMLSMIGIWPSLEKTSACRKLFKCLFIFLSYSFLFATVIPNGLFWVFKANIRIRLRMLPLFTYAMITLVKYGLLIFGQDRIKHCWKYVSEDWRNIGNADARNMMLESAKIGRRLITICAWFYYSSGISLRLIPLLYRGKIVNQYNVTVKLLPTPIYLFSLNTQATPVYEIMYSLQGISGFVGLTIAMGSCSFLIIFVMHACGQLKILMSLMREFIEEQQQTKVDKMLAIVVERQIKIRSFLQLVELTLHQIIFLEISIGTLFICIQSYFIIMEWENKNSIVMISYAISCSSAIVNMFIFCYIGHTLIQQAENAAFVTCELEWYRLPDRKARLIVLLIIMSNKPIKFTVGKFIDLSLQTFGLIMRTALAYLNILRNLT